MFLATAPCVVMLMTQEWIKINDRQISQVMLLPIKGGLQGKRHIVTVQKRNNHVDRSIDMVSLNVINNLTI